VGQEEGLGTVLDDSAKDAEGLKAARNHYRDISQFTERLFTRYVTKNELPLRAVTEKVKELIEAVRSYKRFLLRFPVLSSSSSNYIVEQSVQTAILSITVGLTLRLPPHKLIELGSAALLHEIGMIRLPPQLYMSNKRLTPKERKTLSAHTLLGFKILKQYSFPLSICLTVLECREYINGTGYPRGLTGDKISLHAKIVMVAGSYAAMTSQRPYRPAKDGHAGILELLKDRNTLYDETVLRALVHTLSVYPIGTYVMLADGSWAMVVNTEERPPRAPDVKVLVSTDGQRYSDPVIVSTTTQERQIVRALREDEINQISDGVQEEQPAE
jgi:HD-GYP domain-containing protein (c-di-GMP phosphodiesterase class II)